MWAGLVVGLYLIGWNGATCYEEKKDTHQTRTFFLNFCLKLESFLIFFLYPETRFTLKSPWKEEEDKEPCRIL